MATLEQIEQALRAADAAGNVEDARALAQAYRQMQAETQTAPSQNGPSAQPPRALKPGSREYADWAAAEARAGRKLPQVSEPPPEWVDPASGVEGKFTAGYTSFLNGVPIAGPSILSGAENLRAAVQGVPVEDIQYETRRAQDANPITTGVGGVAGAVAPFMPLAGLPVVGRALGMSGGLASQMGFGAASGGLIAAGDTLARGGNAEDALTSGAIGVGAGGLLPVAGKVLGAGWSALTGTTVPKQARVAGRALKDDQIPASQITRRLQALGPDGMLMDLGPNLQSQAGALAAVPGPAQKTVREAVENRVAAAPSRVANDVAQTVGNGPDIETLKQAITQQQKQAAKPLYDAIRNVPVDVTKGNFGFVLATPMGKAALKNAIELAANDGVVFNNTGMTAGMIDYTKQALDDIAKEAFRQGKDNVGRQASELARVLRTEADKVVPGYKQAREAFAGPAAIKDAIDEGATVFSKDISPDQLRRTWSGMSVSEQDAYIQGVQASLEAQLGNAVNDVASLRNMFKKGWNEEKLRIILGKDIADDLLKRIDRELLFGNTTNVVARNSETARRTASMSEVAPEQADLRQVNLVGGILAAFNAARGAVAQKLRGNANQELAKLLTTKTGQMTPEMVQMLYRGTQAMKPSLLAPGAAIPAINGMGPEKRKPLEITVRGN